MTSETFTYRSTIEAPADRVFRYHEYDGAFERLVPPWENVRVVEKQGGIEDGSFVVLRVSVGGIEIESRHVHSDYRPGRQFRDTQETGPFRSFSHLHRVEPRGDARAELIDEISYELPAGLFGRAVGAAAMRERLARMFRYRHETTRNDVLAHHANGESSRKTILISGAGGLIGQALIPFWRTGGHRVIRLVRRATKGVDERQWDPASGTLDAAVLEGVDAVVHLAGDPIADGRWSAEKKARMLKSRVEGTRALAEAIATIESPPECWLSASAVGIYGARGDEELDETSEPGSGFLADVCRQWEESTQPALERSVRVVTPRIGVVLSPAGGALAKMLPAFRAGVGGRIGSGDQVMSWIALDDLVYAFDHALFD
ncbi:MAG: TIGR01777 family oxidoreductase, partial [Myxococcales bacterium]|nr:TIGR01777 family oxidoreductase [Myxococcales bacterium]